MEREIIHLKRQLQIAKLQTEEKNATIAGMKESVAACPHVCKCPMFIRVLVYGSFPILSGTFLLLFWVGVHSHHHHTNNINHNRSSVSRQLTDDWNQTWNGELRAAVQCAIR